MNLSFSTSTSRPLHKVCYGALLCLFSFLLLFSAQKYRVFADWYSDNIYTLLVSTIGRFFGIFPFSFVEIALYLVISGILASFFRMLIRTFQRKTCNWSGYAANLFLFASIIFLSYTLCCGINYGRSSFSEKTGIQTASYTKEELSQTCKYLTEQVNHLADQVSRDASGIADVGNDVPQKSQAAMYKLAEEYPALEGYYPLPKGLTIPYILSVQNLSGIYSPFTIEANYNSAMTDYNLPFTACHELSHLRGFMLEDEANFIGFLACTNSDDISFQYSGYLMGWLYASNQLYETDYESYVKICEQLADGAKKDLNANSRFWSNYDGQIAEVSNQINDSYLKANGQEEGVVSYDRMVDLLVAYLRQSHPDT